MIDKKNFLDNRGRPLTQSLFLEVGYNTEYAYYTLKDFDYESHVQFSTQIPVNGKALTPRKFSQ